MATSFICLIRRTIHNGKERLFAFLPILQRQKENPYKSGNKALFWDYERVWIDLSVDKDEMLGNMLDEYISAGLSEIEMQDDTPVALKALLYNRFCHWQMADTASFKKWYRDTYLG